MRKGGGTDVLYYSLHACTITQGNVQVLNDCGVFLRFLWHILCLQTSSQSNKMLLNEEEEP